MEVAGRMRRAAMTHGGVGKKRGVSVGVETELRRIMEGGGNYAELRSMGWLHGHA